MPSLPPPGSIPTTYRGTRFRSRLEARWAATFDSLGWYWEYEPYAVRLAPGVQYLCDFHLPRQHVWFEVKSPINDRLDKPGQLRKMLPERELVVIGRPAGPGGLADWRGVDLAYPLGIFRCTNCHEQSFHIPLRHHDADEPYTDWLCRVCTAAGGIDPATRLAPSSEIEAERRRWGRQYVDHFYTGLAFATLSRRGAA